MAQVIYRASHADTNDGRGDITVAHFRREQDAKRASEGFYVMGCKDADVGRVTTVKVYDSFEEWSLDELEKKRQQALSKLTADERAALGV